jgi:hypothetical protein
MVKIIVAVISVLIIISRISIILIIIIIISNISIFSVSRDFNIIKIGIKLLFFLPEGTFIIVC